MSHILLHKFFPYRKRSKKKKKNRERVGEKKKSRSKESQRNVVEYRAGGLSTLNVPFRSAYLRSNYAHNPSPNINFWYQITKHSQNEIHWIDDIKLNISYVNVFLSFCWLWKFVWDVAENRIPLAKCKYWPFSQTHINQITFGKGK